MKRTWRFTQIVLTGAVLVAFGASVAAAQTVLKFSHTDQQQGARQAAAAVREEGRGVHPGPLQSAGLLLQPARQRSQEHRAARSSAASTSPSRHRFLCAAHRHPEPHHAAVHGRQLRAGLEVLRRIEMAAGPVRQGARQGLPLPRHLGSRLPLHDDQGPAQLPPTPRARSCAPSPTR